MSSELNGGLEKKERTFEPFANPGSESNIIKIPFGSSIEKAERYLDLYRKEDQGIIKKRIHNYIRNKMAASLELSRNWGGKKAYYFEALLQFALNISHASDTIKSRKAVKKILKDLDFEIYRTMLTQYDEEGNKTGTFQTYMFKKKEYD